MVRVFIAAIVGGLVVFIWGFVSHAVLPIGHMGVKWLSAPEEGALLPEFKSALTEPGLYMFPGPDPTAPEDEKAWEAKIQAGPRGMLVIDPTANTEPMMSPKKLGIEFASNVLAAMIAAMVVSVISAATITRIFVIALMGVFSWLSLQVSYWNWYGFPQDYTIAALIIEVVGWFAAGIFIAIITPRALVKVAPAWADG